MDRPQLYYGGWINNRLEPATTYYYRVAAVDRWNREGPASPAVAGDHDEVERKEHAAACGRAPHGGARQPDLPLQRRESPLAHELRVRTSAATKSTARPPPGSNRPTATRIALVDVPVDPQGRHRLRPVRRSTTASTNSITRCISTRRLSRPPPITIACARWMPQAGKGRFPREVQATTKAPDPFAILVQGITAQSVYAPQYGVERAIDGSTDPNLAWISKPYGGGTKQNPQDVWWAFQFPAGQKLALAGVKIIGDHRDVIPLQKNLQVQARLQGQWKTVGQAIGARQKDLVVQWPQPVETDAIRVFVPATDLPDGGIVRICELLFLLPDGREAAPADVFSH